MATNIDELMKKFDESTVKEVFKINFMGVDGFDVYNITSPFEDDGKTIIAGRVEKRDSEDSYIMFFEMIEHNKYKLIEDYPTFNLQDPYYTFVDGELILGGTEIVLSEDKKVISYHAVKLRGKNVKSLKPFFKGPKGMKDIRIVELEKNKILCLTRPQGDYGGRGKIGYFICETLEDLTVDKIEKAPLLNLFVDEEWGGANQIFNLNGSKVGVLGHIAKYDKEGDRHYYPISFVLDTNNFVCSDLKILVVRKLLVDGPSKREDLKDVIFSGGLKFCEDKTCEIYMGVSDAEGHYAKIINPFL